MFDLNGKKTLITVGAYKFGTCRSGNLGQSERPGICEEPGIRHGSIWPEARRRPSEVFRRVVSKPPQ